MRDNPLFDDRDHRAPVRRGVRPAGADRAAVLRRARPRDVRPVDRRARRLARTRSTRVPRPRRGSRRGWSTAGSWSTPSSARCFASCVELDLIAAPRPVEVGGQQLPLAVFSLATVYLMAANLGAYGYLGLTQGAAHLLEAFGDAHLRATYMPRMYAASGPARWR
jgi:alkylation response protein AidB-like acyl-CoA dehydrogenase